jgi:dsDNA-binding SOS-regulon protein
MKEDYDEIYGDIKYNVIIFDDESNMLIALFKILEASDNDYLEIWNAPYDMQNLIERPRTLGLDPDLIPSSDFVGKRHVFYKEDMNHLVHKRKHICNTYTKYTVIDQMVDYAGIRSGRGKLPSVRLNAIAKSELESEKVDYSEYVNIRMFPYQNFRLFIKYNINDVLLQLGIDKKTMDSSSIYTTISTDCVNTNQVFTSTLVDGNSLRKFAYEKGFVIGSNANKLYKNNDYNTSEDEIETFDDEYDDSDDEDNESTETSDKNNDKKDKKKDKYAGAIVMAPQHMSPSGYKIMNVLAKYVHIHVIDEDIGSEYPSAMLIMNSCNETMIGKVIVLEPNKIKVKLYDNMYFVDKKDEVGYDKTKDPSNLMMEWLSQDDPIDFGHCVLNLPEPTELLEFIAENKDDFVA